MTEQEEKRVDYIHTMMENNPLWTVNKEEVRFLLEKLAQAETRAAKYANFIADWLEEQTEMISYGGTD